MSLRHVTYVLVVVRIIMVEIIDVGIIVVKLGQRIFVVESL